VTFNPGNDPGNPRQPVATFYQKDDNKLPPVATRCQGGGNGFATFLLCKIGLLPVLPLLPPLHLTSLRCRKNGVFCYNLLHLKERCRSAGNGGNTGNAGNVKKLEAY